MLSSYTSCGDSGGCRFADLILKYQETGNRDKQFNSLVYHFTGQQGCVSFNLSIKRHGAIPQE